jgi:uncharacterized protein (TIGR03086 family)
MTQRTNEPHILLGRAATLAGHTIAAVRPDQLARPTPCAEFDVRGLLGHLVAATMRIGHAGRGEDPLLAPHMIEGVADTEWTTAWNNVADDAVAAWADPARLGEDAVLQFATLPGFVAIGLYTSELTVHTWDLARATDQTVTWDDAVCSSALGIMRNVLPPDRGDEIPFASAVYVGDDAPLIDQLVAWNGRRP